LEEVVVASGAYFHDRQAGGCVGDEDGEEAVASALAEVGGGSGDVDDAGAGAGLDREDGALHPATVPSAGVIDVDRDGNVLLAVHVQPGARRSEVVGWHGDALKVRVAAPPVDGKANRAVVELLASALEADVEIVEGASGRRKRVKLSGVTADEVRARLPD
jgi:uncharacterized protein